MPKRKTQQRTSNQIDDLGVVRLGHPRSVNLFNHKTHTRQWEKLLFSEEETKKKTKNKCPFTTKEIKPSLTEYLDNNIILKNAGSLSGSAYEHKKRGKETKENRKKNDKTKKT